MRILHLDSSLQGEASASRQLSRAIVQALLDASPSAQVRYRDLADEAIPHLDGAIAAGFRSVAGRVDPPVSVEVAAEQARSERLVAEFLDSEVLVIGAPMYNFSVASSLKAWIDRIAQPGRSFRYTADGPVGMSGGRRVIVASTRGGLYSVGAASSMDFQESYLSAFFGFLGITDVRFVRAERLSKGAEIRAAALADAITQLPRAVTEPLSA